MKVGISTINATDGVKAGDGDTPVAAITPIAPVAPVAPNPVESGTATTGLFQRTVRYVKRITYFFFECFSWPTIFVVLPA